jgi:glycine/D-amino acid oxidase-like deaminating enzyme
MRVRSARALSHWHAQLGPPEPRPPLTGPRGADVCIVGAGYTGLWAAYELRRADPSLEVVVLEAETTGFGASGRNGGWLSGSLAGSRAQWAERRGRAGVQALERAIRETVDEVGAVVERERIECDFVKGGSLDVAQTPLELRRLERRIAGDRDWDVGPEHSALLSAAQARERVAVDGICGAYYTPHCARVQPAALAHGLAAACERAGATIHEGTRVTRIEPGVAHTTHGPVRARFVVRATEGYTSALPGLRRAMLPLNSSMIVTEPLAAETWERVGLRQAETLVDGRHRYVYLQRTADGRIAIGGRGVPYRVGSRTDREGPVPARTVRQLHERLVELLPALHGVRVDAAWHGVFGVPRDWAPSVGLDRPTGLAWAGGYVGEGVAAANLAGRTLRDLLLGRVTELTLLPWCRPPARRWEPEPLRFAGARGVHELYRLADWREGHSGRPSLAARAAQLIAGR